MSRLARAQKWLPGEFQDIDEALDKVNAVSAKQVQELAQELAAKDRVITVVGPLKTRPLWVYRSYEKPRYPS